MTYFVTPILEFCQLFLHAESIYHAVFNNLLDIKTWTVG